MVGSWWLCFYRQNLRPWQGAANFPSLLRGLQHTAHRTDPPARIGTWANGAKTRAILSAGSLAGHEIIVVIRSPARRSSRSLQVRPLCWHNSQGATAMDEITSGLCPWPVRLEGACHPWQKSCPIPSSAAYKRFFGPPVASSRPNIATDICFATPGKVYQAL